MSTESVPKVSVVVPIYNVEEFLDECLRSLVHQSLDSYEVVLIDDGSTDSSGEIAQEYARRFENFRYYRKPNGGLGQARNYGAQRATGTYLCFCDSDDVVPFYAYQHLYELAEQRGCDFVSGGVRRLSSNEDFQSSLHHIAFDNVFGDAHITTHPQLFYDTTSWNKLFKRSFYDENNLAWPEGMLYEDIPVTVPAHFLAKKFAFLDETVYYWRTRDRSTVSITQDRTSERNLLDRLKAMHMVDKFFAEHVEDRALHIEKDKKWLRLDLMLYIDELPHAPEEFVEAFYRNALPVIEAIEPEAFVQLDAIRRAKYHAVLERNMSQLKSIIDFEQDPEAIRHASYDANKKGFFANIPVENLPMDACRADHDLASSALRTRITSARLGVKACSIQGTITAGMLDTSALEASSLFDFALEPLPADSPGAAPAAIKAKVIHSDEIPGTFEYSIDLAPSQLSELESGSYRIRVDFSYPHLQSGPYYLSSPVGGAAAHPKSAKRKTCIYAIDYSYCYNLVLTKREVDCPIVAEVHSSANGLELVDTQGNVSVIPESDIHYGESPLLDPKNTPFLYCQLKNTLVSHGGRIISCSKSTTGYMQATELDDGFVLDSFASTETSFTLSLSRLEGSSVLPGPYEATLVGREFGTKVSIPCKGDGGNVTLEINLTDDAVTHDLREDVYNILVRPVNGPAYSAYSLRDYRSSGNPNLAVDGWDYVLRIVYDAIDLRVRRSEQDTTLTDKQIAQLQRKYWLYRHALPVKNNMVVFAAWWFQKANCNPYAFYLYLQENHPEYDCYWLLTDERTHIDGNGKRIRINTPEYWKALAQAKYLFNNVNFPDEYVKRNGQIEIQTTHGTPLKTLGFDVPGELSTPEEERLFAMRCARWNYLVTQGPRAESILASCYRYKKAFLETGFPRNDMLLDEHAASRRDEVRQRLGIPPDKKLVLYAPTWRVKNKFTLALDLTALADELGDEYCFGIRVHSFALRGFNPERIDERVMDLSSISDINELYLATDILITDYSSVMFDYAVLRRPMLFFTYDLEDYRDNLRGFNLDFEREAPGPLLKTTREVIDAISHIDDVADEYKDAYDAFVHDFCSFEEGNACEQIFQTVFKTN